MGDGASAFGDNSHPARSEAAVKDASLAAPRSGA